MRECYTTGVEILGQMNSRPTVKEPNTERSHVACEKKPKSKSKCCFALNQMNVSMVFIRLWQNHGPCFRPVDSIVVSDKGFKEIGLNVSLVVKFFPSEKTDLHCKTLKSRKSCHWKASREIKGHRTLRNGNYAHNTQSNIYGIFKNGLERSNLHARFTNKVSSLRWIRICTSRSAPLCNLTYSHQRPIWRNLNLILLTSWSFFAFRIPTFKFLVGELKKIEIVPASLDSKIFAALRRKKPPSTTSSSLQSLRKLFSNISSLFPEENKPIVNCFPHLPRN